MDSLLLAKKVRKDALIMTNRARASHIAPILSIVDILAALYSVMRFDKNDKTNKLRDRFVLSKGHAGAGLYLSLFHLGFINKRTLQSYYFSRGKKSSSRPATRVNGVEFMTRSLGQGIGVAVGMAIAGKIDNLGYRVFTLVGNGECNEGSVWEAIMSAVALKLDNLTIIVDNNNMQAMGNSDKVLDLGSLRDMFLGFGAFVLEVDGHDHEKLYDALNQKQKGKPTVIIANTIKGKGVSFIENNSQYHYGYVKDELLDLALEEVEKL